jgi:hypothetical protein
MSKIEVDAIDKQSGSTLTLGGSGTAVTLASGATQSGFGRTGTVDWQTTPKTATFTAVSGEGYFANTTGSAFNMNLPAGTAGAIVSVADYAATFQTNNLTIVPNGSDKIGSLNEDAILSTEGQSITLVYVDSTQGWINTMDSTSNVRGAPPFIVATGGTITTSGDCKIHTFTGPGTFTVTCVAQISARNQVSYMVVAGGGGGGAGDMAPSLPSPRAGGGGGAGGFREDKSPLTPYTASPLEGAGTINVTATAFPITVGGGGAKGPVGGSCNGSSGSNSVFSTITSAGGGGGGTAYMSGPIRSAHDGGSGGGGSSGGGSSNGAGGNGNTPPVSPAQGFNGGSGATNPGQGGDGGGGATVAGSVGGGPSAPSPDSPGGNGGNGATTNITASPVVYAGGGGGGAGAPPTTGGSGGTGGGGAGASHSPSAAGGAGTTNIGGGGGGGAGSGGGNHCGGNGGS